MLGVMLPPSGVMKAIDLQVCDLKLQKLVKPFARLHDHSKTLVSTYSDSCMGNTVAGFAMAVRFLTGKSTVNYSIYRECSKGKKGCRAKVWFCPCNPPRNNWCQLSSQYHSFKYFTNLLSRRLPRSCSR
ncbi:uncharacterized protein [Henckelia pumila]|uniref:uncharacterized protein isoform X1 n=1 Tax=Henckelia pumila TaxID=405737 RepID=UPI003C6DCCAD